MSNIYILSGLGADERAFQKIDFSGFDPVFIRWIKPEKDESIELYASRLRQQIVTPNPTLIGLSFGGMVAVEVAKQIQTKQVILLASAKSKYEIPKLYRFGGRTGFVKFLPVKLLKRSNFISNWLFGVETTFEKQLLRQILADTDADFMKWAIHAITVWENEKVPENITHIHGTKDRILPFRNVKCDIAIEGGGHFMTLSKAEEIMGKLKMILQE